MTDANGDMQGLVRSQEFGLSAFHSDDGLDRLVSLLAGLAGVPFAAFWVIEDGQQFLASAHGNISRTLPKASVLGQRAISSDGILEVPDARQDPRLSQDPLVTGAPGIRFFAALPIKDAGGQAIGALCTMSTESGAMNDSARAALRALAGLLEDRLRLRSDVLHDPQTGALTRKQFDDVADREWRRAMRAMVPISLIVAELDRLPSHSQATDPALDRGIRAAALAMQYSVHRPGDCVGRLDRYRFATLLYGTDGSNATLIAERTRLAVESLQIPFPGHDKVMTLSQGISAVPPKLLTRCDLDQMLIQADSALSRAIDEGGNAWRLAPTQVLGVSGASQVG